MECMGCEKIADDKILVKLRTGQVVCSTCEAWRMETEARALLAMPLDRRRMQLEMIEKHRGEAATNALKKEMTEIHRAMKYDRT